MSKDYPLPEDFKAIFGVDAAYDSEWVSFEYKFICEEQIELFFSFSELTLGTILKVTKTESKKDMLLATIDNVISIIILKDEKKIMIKSKSQGFRHELIVNPFGHPIVEFINIFTNGILD